jgi:hypothetical protein
MVERLPHETFAVGLVRRIEDFLPCLKHRRSLAVVDDARRQECNPGVVVFLVVPGEESLAEDAGVLLGAKTLWESRAVLERLELRLGVGIVVGDMRPAVRLGDAEVRKQLSDGLGGHGRAAIGVDGELTGVDALFDDGFGNKASRQGGAFFLGEISKVFFDTR